MVNKRKDGISDLYSLADLKDDEGNEIRRDEAFAKNYLTGSYGAILELKPMRMLRGNHVDRE